MVAKFDMKNQCKDNQLIITCFYDIKIINYEDEIAQEAKDIKIKQ